MNFNARFLLVVGMLLAPIVQAAPINVASFDVKSSMMIFGASDHVTVSITDDYGFPTYAVLSGLSFTPEDVGVTFSVNSLNDADFDKFSVSLTNGVNDRLGYAVNLPPLGGGGVNWDELNMFTAGTRSFGLGNVSSIGTFGGPDFAGYDIVRLDFTINALTLSTSGDYTSLNLDAVAKIYATPVPEPSTYACLVGGLVLVYGVIYRRRIRS